MNIVFRVDASIRIGSGHVMRCLTLANALQKAGHCVLFICRDYPGSLIEFISQQQFDVIALPFDMGMAYTQQPISDNYQQWLWVSAQVDVEETVAHLKCRKIDWMIVDHYALSDIWEKQIRPYVKHMMVIDDLANRVHQCDILLDQNYYIDLDTRYDPYVPAHCTRLLGPTYALIRADFLKLHADREKQGKHLLSDIHQILIFMGGVDLENMTLRILKYFQAHGLLLKYQLNVVLGVANPNETSVKNFCEMNPSVSYHVAPREFNALIASADLIIGAGGSSVYERCLAGVPSCVFSLADNQKKICEDVAKFGAHVFVENIEQLSTVLSSLTKERRQKIIDACAKLFAHYEGVDGVVNAIQTY